MPNFSSNGQEMAEILRIQRTCGGGWGVVVVGGGGGWWIPSKNLVTSDRLVRVSRSRSESVTILDPQLFECELLILGGIGLWNL